MHMPELLTRILKSQNFKPILKQLIQTATIFVHNLTNTESISKG